MGLLEILVCSDSHKNVYNIHKAIKKNKDIKTVIHLGDMVRDIEEVEYEYKGIDFYYVRGNNDWIYDVPSYRIVNILDKKIFITHGHDFGVKQSYDRIVAKGKEFNVDAVLFGHTHQAEEFFCDGIMYLNPGSIGDSRVTNRTTYSIVRIKDGKIGAIFKSL